MNGGRRRAELCSARDLRPRKDLAGVKLPRWPEARPSVQPACPPPFPLLAAAGLALALALAGCNPYPDSYPLPEQRPALTAEEAGESRMFVAMNAADAESYFASDIRGLEGGQWRWTGQEPTLHFVLDHTDNLNFVMDYSVAGAIIGHTGPMTISVYVNDRLLGEVRHASHGENRFEKPVDPSWLEAGQDTIVRVAIDKVWVSPRDNVKLGIILSRAGFVGQ